MRHLQRFSTWAARSILTAQCRRSITCHDLPPTTCMARSFGRWLNYWVSIIFEMWRDLSVAHFTGDHYSVSDISKQRRSLFCHFSSTGEKTDLSHSNVLIVIWPLHKTNSFASKSHYAKNYCRDTPESIRIGSIQRKIHWCKKELEEHTRFQLGLLPSSALHISPENRQKISLWCIPGAISFSEYSGKKEAIWRISLQTIKVSSRSTCLG